MRQVSHLLDFALQNGRVVAEEGNDTGARFRANRDYVMQRI